MCSLFNYILCNISTYYTMFYLIKWWNTIYLYGGWHRVKMFNIFVEKTQEKRRFKSFREISISHGNDGLRDVEGKSKSVGINNPDLVTLYIKMAYVPVDNIGINKRGNKIEFCFS